jgi:hypothetical protein
LVNPSIYHSEVVKVRKMLVNASISGFYQTILVNASIYQHQSIKAQNKRYNRSIYIKVNVNEYVCVLLGSGGVFFGVLPVAVTNKIKYITCC